MTAFETAFEKISILVNDFQNNLSYFMSPTYQESEVRKSFIDKFFKALGWDVDNDYHPNPYEQEVKVEKAQRQQESKSQRRADYAFYKSPNYKDVSFFVEAKKPFVQLKQEDNYFQTIRYGWNAQTPIAVLTDFEQFHIIDCRLKPNVKTVFDGNHKEYHYKDYLDKEKFAEIYWLFSNEAVKNNSLKKYANSLPKLKSKSKDTVLFKLETQPIDESFLEYIDKIREDLAAAFNYNDNSLDSEQLTEAVQRTIDRLVFIRFLEDKLIEGESHVTEWRGWKDFITDCRKLDAKYNGIVFKRHFIDEQTFSGAQEKLFKSICSDISSINSPYDFNYIPIHILGSIYERFLGKIVVTTDKKVSITEKLEVRKAGGVYYTPKYIVDHIVTNTIGRLLKGKSPKEIALFKFADIACGSGSFLIGVYDYLLDVHKTYYSNKLKDKTEIDGRSEDYGNVEYKDGQWHLTLKLKQQILLNNIFGFDIDGQAVEVTQLSLFLKMLEDERLITDLSRQFTLFSKVLPDLSKNIICGNTLIGVDIIPFKGGLFENEELKKLNPLDFKAAVPQILKANGFDVIIGNPPWGAELTQLSKKYLLQKYPWIDTKVKDSYSFFISAALNLLKPNGILGYIIPNTWLLLNTAGNFRKKILEKDVNEIADYGDGVFKDATVESSTLIMTNRKSVKDDVLVFRYRKGQEILNQITQKSLWLKDSASRIILEMNKTYDGIIQKCKLGSDIFQTNSEIIWGIKPYQVGYGDPPQTKEILDNRLFHSDKNQGDLWKPLLVGSNIDRYILNDSKIQYIKYGKWLMYPSDESKMLGKKILMRQTSDKIRAVIDEAKFYCQNSVFIVTTSLDYEYLLALLNSSLFNFLYKLSNPQTEKVFAEIKPSAIKSLPIKKVTKKNKPLCDSIITLSKSLLQYHKEYLHSRTEKNKNFLDNLINSLDKEINQKIFALYELSQKEIEVVESLR